MEDMMAMDSSRQLMIIKDMTTRRGMIMGMITRLMEPDSMMDMVGPRLVVDMAVRKLVVGMVVPRLEDMVLRMLGMRTRMLEADTSIRDMTSMVMPADKTASPSLRSSLLPCSLIIHAYYP